jgi:hypothetical protein
MKEVYTFEGELVALKDSDAASEGLQVRVTKFIPADFDPVGKLVRVTIEIIDNNETFEEVIGSIPPEVIADERDELES